MFGLQPVPFFGVKVNKNSFFTADWHIGHENAIKFDQRPFKSVDHMHRVLINNYNSTVGSNDICYFLGDIGCGKGDTVKKVMSQLNGTKILIIGNHDKKGRQFWMSCGFAVVLNSAAIHINKDLVTMTHCPLRGIWREDVTNMRGATPGDNWHGESKHNRFSIPDYGQFHLHGHIHSGPHRDDKKTILGKQFDVGVVANKYTPVSISRIESWVAKYGR